MKTDISITVKRTEDSGYRGNMYLGFAALFEAFFLFFCL